METFIEAKPFVHDSHYWNRREEILRELDRHIIPDFDCDDKDASKHCMDVVDTPIVEIVRGYASLSYCFPLQSCYGHFLHGRQKNPKNVKPLLNYLDANLDSRVDYRIAYMAFCIQNCDSGRKLYRTFKALTEIDPEYVQFGSADWFWKHCPNSFVLQIELSKSKTEDRVFISKKEALHIEKLRNQMFEELERILLEHQ